MLVANISALEIVLLLVVGLVAFAVFVGAVAVGVRLGTRGRDRV